MVAKATPQMEEARETSPETPPDSPLLDLAGAGIKKMIKLATKLGYVTHKATGHGHALGEGDLGEDRGHSGDV